MTQYILRRLIQSIPTLFGITVFSFLIMVAAPGGPAAALSYNPKMSPAERMRVAEQLGVNDPVIVQYLRWLIGNDFQQFPVYDSDGEITGYENGTSRGILRGDFGRSFTANRNALEVIVDKIPATVELTATSFLLSLLIGLPLGLFAAVWQGGAFDQFTRVMAVVFSAVPTFWLGLMMLLIFGSWLDLLPMGNRFPLMLMGEPTLNDRILHLIMPVTVLALTPIAIYSRFMRAAVLDVLNKDYVRTAKSKGLGNRRIWYTHAMRNALIPIATLVGPAIPSLIGGALVVELIFSWPGVGRLTFEAVTQQDYNVVMASVVIGAVVTIVGYLLTDVLYALADPRVRLS